MMRNRPRIDRERRYNVKEVCEMLCICRDTIRRYTQRGIIVPIVVSKREIYYSGREVDKLYFVLTMMSRKQIRQLETYYLQNKEESHAEDR